MTSNDSSAKDLLPRKRARRENPQRNGGGVPRRRENRANRGNQEPDVQKNDSLLLILSVVENK
jgi:hypothetical protein